MKKKQKQIALLIFLIVLLLVINYQFLDKALENFLLDSKIGKVERVIDGDTIVINGTSIRLLGINSPERNEIYYSEAKSFLEEILLNKTVRLEYGKDKKDKYGRDLAYVFFEEKNINLELVENGFANFYFPQGKDIYYNDFVKAWEKCIEENENLCESSGNQCAKCIELKKLDYKNQEIIFFSNCEFDCDLNGWEIKDEGRKYFIFDNFVLKSKKEIKIKVGEGENNESILFWQDEDYVWTSTSDTLFLRDENGKLVLWERY